jgi:hypothetical protein
MGNSVVFKGLADNIRLRYANCVKDNKWVTGDSTKVDSVNADGYAASGNWNGGNINPTLTTAHSGEVTYYHSGSSTDITASTIPKGKTVIVEINGTATVKGNITYTNENLSSIYDIPQVVIFANNIDIEPQVTQIDAWLMIGLDDKTSNTKIGGNTTGEINTCANGVTENSLIAINRVYQYNHGVTMPSEDSFSGDGDPENSKQCNSRLKINGPVQAKKLRLLRSYGAGMGLNECRYNYKDNLGYTDGNQADWPNGGRYANCGTNWYGTGPFPHDSATPAEVFNLRADAYLWAYRQTENYSQAFVTYSREVAPRW